MGNYKDVVSFKPNVILSCLFIDDTLNMESVWSLALVVKSVVVATVDTDGERSSVPSSIPMLLQQQQFVESVSFLAHQGTGLSQKWIVEDLEVTKLVNVIVCYYSTDIRPCRILHQN